MSVIAHRGAHQREPENTLASFAEALALGVDGIELDVRLTGSGHLVCLHDPYTRRLLGRSGRVSRKSLEELLEFEVQHPTRKRRRPIATLNEALELLSDSVEIILDLKQESVRRSPLEQETVGLLREHGLCDNVVISSFNPWVLKRVRQIAPEFRTALIAGTRLEVALFHPAYCDTLHVHHSLLARKWFAARVTGKIVVWTVDRRTELPRPIPDFVRGIITNQPGRWLASAGPGQLARRSKRD